jgi:hypothetical protein
MHDLPLLTASRLAAARRCQRRHHYAYGLGYRAVEDADALRLGTLVHAGLAAWWAALGDQRFAVALEVLRAADADPYEAERASAMLAGYDARWGLGAEYETLAVEVPFRAPLVNPETHAPSRTWQLAGKIDAIVRDAHGDVWIVEHKTTSEDVTPGSPYWRRLRMDGQVSLYFIGARALGYEPRGCLYDVLCKPGIRPLRATPIDARKYTKDGRLYAAQREFDETVEQFRDRVTSAIAEDLNAYYARGEVVRLDGELDEGIYDVWQLAAQLRESDRLGRYPRNPDGCLRYGRNCEYFDVCSGDASLDDPSRFRLISDTHPELASE